MKVKFVTTTELSDELKQYVQQVSHNYFTCDTEEEMKTIIERSNLFIVAYDYYNSSQMYGFILGNTGIPVYRDKNYSYLYDFPSRFTKTYFEELEERAEIGLFVVFDQYRKKGLGLKLFKMFMNHCKGKFVGLYSHLNYTYKFYERYGFHRSAIFASGFLYYFYHKSKKIMKRLKELPSLFFDDSAYVIKK